MNEFVGQLFDRVCDALPDDLTRDQLTAIYEALEEASIPILEEPHD